MINSGHSHGIEHILDVVNGVVGARGSIRDDQLERLWGDAQELRSAGENETYYLAKLALATVSPNPPDIKGIIDEALSTVGASLPIVGDGSAALARLFRNCDAAELLLSHSDELDYPPLLLQQAVGIYFLAGHLAELNKAVDLLVEKEAASACDLDHRNNANRYWDWLRKRGINEAELQALSRLRDRAVAESDINPLALRAADLNYRQTIDESDAVATTEICFPLATDEEIHAVSSRHHELRAESGLPAHALRTVTFTFINRRSVGADTRSGAQRPTPAERAADG